MELYTLLQIMRCVFHGPHSTGMTLLAPVGCLTFTSVFLSLFQILTIPVKALIAVGTLSCSPKHIIMPPSFPVSSLCWTKCNVSPEKNKVGQIRVLFCLPVKKRFNIRFQTCPVFLFRVTVLSRFFFFFLKFCLTFAFLELVNKQEKNKQKKTTFYRFIFGLKFYIPALDCSLVLNSFEIG